MKYQTIESLVEWITRNPDLAEMHYPEITKGLSERTREWPDVITANIVEDITKSVQKWDNEMKAMLPNAKLKKTEGVIQVIDAILNLDTDSHIILLAIEKMRIELVELKNHYTSQYNKIALSLEPPKRERRIKTYIYLGKPDELTKFAETVRDSYRLFHSETTNQQVNDAFTNKEVKNIVPIKWHDDNASELLYFIKKLKRGGIIEGGERNNYKQIIGIFIKNTGNPFKEDFKSLNQRLDIDLSKQKKEKIDILISELQ